MKNHIGNRWEIMILGNPQIEWPLEPQQPLWGRRGLLRWVNIGHFFSFSLPTKRGTNPLGAPLMRSAYSMRKFRPRWTSSSSLFFFLSNLLFFSFLKEETQNFRLLRKWWTQFSQSHWGKWMYWVHRNHLLSALPKVLSGNEGNNGISFPFNTRTAKRSFFAYVFISNTGCSYLIGTFFGFWSIHS